MFTGQKRSFVGQIRSFQGKRVKNLVTYTHISETLVLEFCPTKMNQMAVLFVIYPVLP